MLFRGIDNGDPQLNGIPKSWVMRLPRGLREQPGWVFIGTLCALVGLSYMLGISETSITRVLSLAVLRIWGGFLCVSGVLVVYSTVTANRPLEKLSLRFLSLGLFIYMAWAVVAVSIQRATIAVFMGLSLIILSEIRVAVLKILLRPLPDSATTQEVD